ncbi:MAG: DUF4361 domain-containing protein [Barnesiella sp.]|nr:DUF4361 domain-containing protein [Barnesiella sp.]
MKIKFIIPTVMAAAAMLTACDENDQFKGELYEKVIYVLSDNDLMFSSVHQLGETTPGYVTVYCGGTEHITSDVTVELEPYAEALDHYNYVNYDLDESRYARLLDPSHYTIDNYSTVLKANSPDYYSLIPINVNPDGLSPDSTYIVPLRIKSVSDFRVNPDKEAVLYRVVLANKYATMEHTTYYQMAGVETLGLSDGDVASGISVTRVIAPLASNKIRVFAGTHSYVPNNVTLDEINTYAMTVTLNDDHTLDIASYGDLEVEMLDNAESNYWEYNEKGWLLLYMNYRYMDTVTYNGKTETCWVTMDETNTYKPEQYEN